MIIGSSIIGSNIKTAVGPTGPTGPTGPVGPIGPTGLTLGATGNTGVYITDFVKTPNIKFVFSDGSQSQSFVGFTGPTGFYSDSRGVSAYTDSQFKSIFSGVVSGKTFEFKGICGAGNIISTLSVDNSEVVLTINDYSASVLYGQSAPNFVIYTTDSAAAVSSKIGITGSNSVLSFGLTADTGVSGSYVKVYSDFVDKLYTNPVIFDRNTTSIVTDDVIVGHDSSGLILNLSKYSSYKLSTPIAIKQFIVPSAVTEIQSYTLFIDGSDVWNFPDNVYFENTLKGIQNYGFLSGLNILHLWTANGGVTFNASFVERGLGSSDYYNASVGSCCYDNETQCIDYISPEKCKDVYNGIFNPLKTCSDSCGVFGSCCIDCRCYDNVNQAICSKYDGVFNQTKNCSEISSEGGCCPPPPPSEIYDFKFIDANLNEITQTILRFNSTTNLYEAVVPILITVTHNDHTNNPVRFAPVLNLFDSGGKYTFTNDKGFVFELTLAKPENTADLDGSGTVDAGDIGSLLILFGQSGGPGDLDGSGTVDAGDIGSLLISFGSIDKPNNGIITENLVQAIYKLKITHDGRTDPYGRALGVKNTLQFEIRDQQESKTRKPLDFYINDTSAPEIEGCESCENESNQDNKFKMQSEFVINRRCYDCAVQNNNQLEYIPLKKQKGYINFCASKSSNCDGINIEVNCISWGPIEEMWDCKNSKYANDNNVHLEYNENSSQTYWEENLRSCNPESQVIQLDYKQISEAICGSNGVEKGTCKGEIKTCVDNSSNTFNPYFNTIDFTNLETQLLNRGIITANPDGTLTEDEKEKLEGIISELQDKILTTTNDSGQPISLNPTIPLDSRKKQLNESLLKCCAGEEIYSALTGEDIFSLGFAEPDDPEGDSFEVKYLLFMSQTGNQTLYTAEQNCYSSTDTDRDLFCNAGSSQQAEFEFCNSNLILKVARVVINKTDNTINKDRSCFDGFFQTNRLLGGWQEKLTNFQPGGFNFTDNLDCECVIDNIELKKINFCPLWSIWLLGEIKQEDLLNNKIQFTNSTRWDPTKEKSIDVCENTNFIFPYNWTDEVNLAKTKPVYTEMDTGDKFEYGFKIFESIFNTVECNTTGENDLRCRPLNSCFLNDYYQFNSCFCNCSPYGDINLSCGQGPVGDLGGRLVLEIQEDRLNDKLKLKGIWYNCASGNCEQSNIPAGKQVWADYGNGEVEDFSSYMSTASGDPPEGLKEIPFYFSNSYYSEYCYDPYTDIENDGTFSGCTAEPYALYPTLTMIEPIPSGAITVLGRNSITGIPVAFASAKIDKIDSKELDIKDYLDVKHQNGGHLLGLRVIDTQFSGNVFEDQPLDITLYLSTSIYPQANTPDGIKPVNFEYFNISCTLVHPTDTTKSITRNIGNSNYGRPAVINEFEFLKVPTEYTIDSDQGKYKFIITFTGELNIENSSTIQGNYLLPPDNESTFSYTNPQRSVSYSIYYIADTVKGNRPISAGGLPPIVKNKSFDGVCVSIDCSQLPGLCTQLEDC